MQSAPPEWRETQKMRLVGLLHVLSHRGVTRDQKDVAVSTLVVFANSAETCELLLDVPTMKAMVKLCHEEYVTSFQAYGALSVICALLRHERGRVAFLAEDNSVELLVGVLDNGDTDHPKEEREAIKEAVRRLYLTGTDNTKRRIRAELDARPSLTFLDGIDAEQDLPASFVRRTRPPGH